MKLTRFLPHLLLAVLLPLATPALEAGPFKKSVEQLDVRIRRSAERLIAMQAEPGKRIPTEILAEDRGIIILHKIKAGIGIGGEAGNGVALVRDKESGRWSAPAFIASAEGSYGLQFGAQESDLIMLLMNDVGLKPLLGGSLNVGVDVEAAVGPADRGGEIDTTTLKAPILVYSNSGGFFAGAAFKGGGIIAAKRNNQLYYGHSMTDILFEKAARPSRTGEHLIDVIETYAGRRKR